MFRAGDIVKHLPSGDEWVLAIDQEGDRVSWCGWLEGQARAGDCVLVKAATDEERKLILTEVAMMGNRDNGRPDHRTTAAIRQLKPACSACSGDGGIVHRCGK